MISAPLDNIHHVPLDCPVCHFAMRHQNDLDAYDVYTCCEECSLHFAQANREKWILGWRPPQKIIDHHRKRILSQSSYLCKISLK